MELKTKTSKYNFKNPPNRVGTNCYKWDGQKKFLGYENLIPMHVADNDFFCAPEILEEIQKRAAKATFGYTIHPDNFFEAFASDVFRQIL